MTQKTSWVNVDKVQSLKSDSNSEGQEFDYQFTRGGQNAFRTSAIAEVALRTKVFKICCALIALRFQNSFG